MSERETVAGLLRALAEAWDVSAGCRVTRETLQLSEGTVDDPPCGACETCLFWRAIDLAEQQEQQLVALGRALVLWRDWESPIGKAGWERVPQCDKAFAAAKAGGAALALLPEATLAKIEEAK